MRINGEEVEETEVDRIIRSADSYLVFGDKALTIEQHGWVYKLIEEAYNKGFEAGKKTE